MDENHKPRIQDLAVEQDFWNAHRKILRKKGLDPDRLLAEWATGQAQSLGSPGASEDFAELCKDGCLPQGLAVVVALLRYHPLLERFWTEMVGHPVNRDKASRTLENSAQTLEGLFGEIIAKEKSGENDELTKIGRLPVSRMVEELRMYIRFIHFAQTIRADTETRSPAQVAKYLLTSYVKCMTGRFHDRSVSGLVGEVLGPSDYNEVAQRMWRSRNYERIDKHYSWITRFLVAMSVVIASPE